MDTFETLQDFALNLLNDPRAFSAFETDPEAALGAAGLGDVSALDVREILPLVLDYAPAQGLGDLSVLEDSPLSGVTGQVQDLAGDFSPVTDLGQGLDADVLGGTLDGVGDLGTTLHGVGNLDGVGVGVGDLGAQGQVSDLVGDLTAGTSALDTTHLDTTVQDITTGDLSGVTDNALHLTDVAQVGDVVSGVGQVEDITSGVSGVGDISEVVDLGHIDVGGILNGNDVSF